MYLKIAHRSIFISIYIYVYIYMYMYIYICMIYTWCISPCVKFPKRHGPGPYPWRPCCHRVAGRGRGRAKGPNWAQNDGFSPAKRMGLTWFNQQNMQNNMWTRGFVFFFRNMIWWNLIPSSVDIEYLLRNHGGVEVGDLHTDFIICGTIEWVGLD